MAVAGEPLLVPARSPLEQIAAGFGEVFEGMRRARADAVIMSSFVSLLLVLAGFGSFWLAWKGAAATLSVGVQIAFLTSGGLSGFALIAAGLGIMYVQMSRHLEAREDREWAVVLDKALGMLEVLKRAGRLTRVPAQNDVAG